MAFNGKYEMKEDGINEIISEKGDKFLALREIRWSPNKPFKLDLRHYKSDENGDITLKGVSFTDDDADYLTETLIRNGFGDNDDIARAIADERPDLFRTIHEMDDSGNGEDARRRLFSRRAAEDENSDEEGYFTNSEKEDDVTYYRPDELLA